MRHRYRSVIVGRVVVATCMQASGALVVDPATTTDEQGRLYHGWAVLLKPWRARSSATVHTRALVLGWRRG